MKKIFLNSGVLVLFTLFAGGCYTVIIDSPSEVNDNSTTIIINYPPPVSYPVGPVNYFPFVPDNRSTSGTGSAKIRTDIGGRGSSTTGNSNISHRRTGTTVERSGSTNSGNSKTSRDSKSTDNRRHR